MLSRKLGNKIYIKFEYADWNNGFASYFNDIIKQLPKQSRWFVGTSKEWCIVQTKDNAEILATALKEWEDSQPVSMVGLEEYYGEFDVKEWLSQFIEEEDEVTN